MGLYSSITQSLKRDQCDMMLLRCELILLARRGR